MIFQCLLVASLLPISTSLDIEECDGALGMETGTIPDASLSASSSFDSDSVGPASARIRTDKNGGAWCPERQISSETYEYLEINLGSLHVVSAVETQGRWGGGAGKEYPTQYVLEYYRPGAADWMPYRNRRGDKLLTGNTDTNTGVLRRLTPPVVASRLRIVPFSVYPRTMCLRAEVYGCPHKQDLIAYSGPMGWRGPVGLDVRDDRYDGFAQDGWLEGGLGQLSDGELGSLLKDLPTKPPKSDGQSGSGGGSGVPSTLVPAWPWVGWSRRPSGWLELLFRFDSPRNFSAARLHAQHRAPVGAPAKATVQFSLQGQVFTSPKEIELDQMDEEVGWLKVPLVDGVGKYVKLRLKFSDSWLLLSEVTFDSALVKNRNLTRALAKAEELRVPSEPLPVEVEETKTAQDTPTPVSPDSSPLGSLRLEYVALLIGALLGLLGLCTLVVLCCVLRRRRSRKLFGSSSPAYSGLKPAASNGTGSSSLSSGGHSGGSAAPPHITLIQDALAANGTLRRQLPDYHQLGATLRQGPDGTLYVAAEEKRPLPSLPSWNGFHFPPPPPPEALVHTDSSEYAEPADVRTHSTATLPLLGSPVMAQRRSAQGSYSTQSRPTPPPRTNLSSPRPPRSPYRRRTSPRHVASPRLPVTPEPLRESDSEGSREESCHYASSQVPGCRRSIQGGCGTAQPIPACPLSPLPAAPPQISRSSVRLEGKLGEGEFGEVHVATLLQAPSDYELEEREELVALKLLRPSATAAAKRDFERELRVLAKLRDPNLVQLVGAVTAEEPWGLVVEYTALGDLASFLRQPRRRLPQPALMFMAAQIASGMKYLEARNCVHRDLAARNCLVGEGLSVKVGDFGMAQACFAADYHLVEGKFVLPVRWMSWEAILLGAFSPASDVWAFAVTLWELLTRAATQPLPHLSDEDVVALATELSVQTSPRPLLPQPGGCPVEVFDLMRECWQRDAADRPSFQELHLFLQRQSLGFDPRQYSTE